MFAKKGKPSKYIYVRKKKKKRKNGNNAIHQYYAESSNKVKHSLSLAT